MSRIREEVITHSAWVRRLARQLLADSHLSEDVAQEALAVALEHPESLPSEPAKMRRWLAGVTRNLARGAARREGHRRSVERRVARDERDDAGLQTSERIALQRRLASAVEELEEPYRTLIVLRYFDDLAPREIARRQALPAATVRKRLSRGLEQLRGRLDREFGGRESWCVALAGLEPSMPAPLASLIAGPWLVASAIVAGLAVLTWSVVARPTAIGPSGENLVPRVGLDSAALEGGRSSSRREDLRQPVVGAEAPAERPAIVEAGRTISGRLLVDGEPPGEELELELRSHDATDEETRRVSVNPKGEFSASGLPDDWSGRIAPPEGHWFLRAESPLELESEQSLSLGKPHEGLYLETTRLPTIRGRLLESASGSPLVNVGAMVSARLDCCVNTSVMGASTNAEGEFVIPVRLHRHNWKWRNVDERPGLWRIQLRVHSGEHVLLERSYLADEIPTDGDLGDIRLEPATAELFFRTVDEQEQPVANAVVGSAGRFSKPTDAGGYGRLQPLAFDRGTVFAGAFGKRIEEHWIGTDRGTPEKPRTLVLVDGNEFRLKVEDASGNPIPGLCVELLCERPLRPDEDDHPPLSSEAQSIVRTIDRESGWQGGARTGDASTEIYGPGNGERLCITQLPPHIAFDVRLYDALGRRIAEERISGLGPTEKRAHEITLEMAAAVLRGRVVDERGAGIADASLSPRASLYGRYARTNDEGHYSFEPFLPGPDPVDFTIKAEGFVTLQSNDHLFLSGSSVPNFVLESARNATVGLFHVNGVPAEVSWVQVQSEGQPSSNAKAIDRGRWAFRGITRRAARVVTRLGGREYSWPLDSGIEEATFELPLHGRVLLNQPDGSAGNPNGRYQIDGSQGGESKLRLEKGWPIEGPPLRLHLLPGAWKLELALYQPSTVEPSAVWRADVIVEADREVHVQAADWER